MPQDDVLRVQDRVAPWFVALRSLALAEVITIKLCRLLVRRVPGAPARGARPRGLLDSAPRGRARVAALSVLQGRDRARERVLPHDVRVRGPLLLRVLGPMVRLPVPSPSPHRFATDLILAAQEPAHKEVREEPSVRPVERGESDRRARPPRRRAPARTRCTALRERPHSPTRESTTRSGSRTQPRRGRGARAAAPARRSRERRAAPA